ncbi:MAG: HAD-IIB family hydrolase [Dehalococcoidales bacterium]|nr:MAG: HAD-IIB family hydrolase [Dehalococcoidales bacterium]
MTSNYKQISPELARHIRLVMADVDGTLTDEDGSESPSACEAVRQLEQCGITVGFVSGRHLSNLEALAQQLDISGPIIAENGGVAKLKPDSEILNLGYSREPALKELNRIKQLFPGAIREREDNAERLVDVVFFINGIAHKVVQEQLRDIQYYDSGYVLHLMERGISKGRTLLRLLNEIGYQGLSSTDTVVIGDSPTDISLFELFPYSVLIPNPRLTNEQRQAVQRVARYTSDLHCGDGFTEVANYIATLRDC